MIIFLLVLFTIACYWLAFVSTKYGHWAAYLIGGLSMTCAIVSMMALTELLSELI